MVVALSSDNVDVCDAANIDAMRKREYIDYIKYASLVSSPLALAMTVWGVLHLSGNFPFILLWISVAMQACIYILSALLKNDGTSAALSKMSELVFKLKTRTVGRITVALFFFYLAAILFETWLSGGAAHSFLSGLLLINATFGYGFANNPAVKRCATIVPLVAFVVTAVWYYDPVSSVVVFGPFDDPVKLLDSVLWPAVVAVLVAFITLDEKLKVANKLVSQLK